MKNYLLDIMQHNTTGLYLCELPTGYGKTYDSVYAMKKYIDTIKDNRKIIYLTTLNKNLPEKPLTKAYINEEVYKKNVLRIRSNFDEVVEKIDKVKVSDNLKSKTYDKLCKDINLYHTAIGNNCLDKDYIFELSERINEGERNFRYDIRKHLYNKFHDKTDRKNAIKKNPQYKWIGELYPAVFTDDYKILLMSISKFMKKNSILIDESYEFLNSDIINNAIIIIDEFDATKATLQGELIEKSLATKEDYVQLFRQIYRMLKPDDFSIDMMEALECISTNNNKNTFKTLISRAEKIAQTYHIRLSIKTTENMIAQKQVFLFNDGSFHTVLHNGAQYIRATLNQEDNRVDVFFENKEDFFKNRNKTKDIILYGMLREINAFLSRFRLFVIEWANSYMKIVNQKRSTNADEMSLDNAVSSILRRLELNTNQCKLLMGEICPVAKKTGDFILEDRSFYQVGMEYYEFEDNDSHYDSTNLKFIKMYDTPEKILLYLSKKALVFGISASAEFNTVVGNYDLGYLKRQLKENYHSTPEYLKEKVKKELEARWSAYDKGEIKIHGEIIPNKIQCFDTREYCRSFLDGERADFVANKINNITSKEYEKIRYCNILRAMHIFWETEDIQSMLYLGMALPKKDNSEMNEDLIIKLFQFASGKSKAEFDKEENVKFVVLRGDNFDKDKEKLLESLGEGQKIFVMSSYQTIGAGQNLQYKIPKNKKVVYLGKYIKGDERFSTKDFDAIYLGNITHMAVNIYSEDGINESELLKMLFQVEELYQNGEISYSEKDKLIKSAFGSYSGIKQYEYNKLYSLKSVVIQASRAVLQAVGRMNRTFAKNPNIYLFIESALLENLYVGELKNHILSPEMKKIVAMREALGKNYLDKEDRILNTAEKISSEGHWFIKRILSKNWNLNSMTLWENLRTLVLQYPTASEAEWEANEYIKKLYITSGKKQKCYLYSQYSDFNDVIIDFENDKIAFRNSGRAKRKGASEEVGVYEMNEKESRLPDILKYPKMKEYFEENGYAVTFNENDYLMSPILFHNIYKGVLGEVSGKFILKRELGIELKPITEPDYFEFFDYRLSENVYVDFKNWKYSYIQDKEETRAEILKKADAIGAKRVYIINVVSDKEYKPAIRIDHRLVEIPKLINEKGTINKKCLHMILREDFE